MVFFLGLDSGIISEFGFGYAARNNDDENDRVEGSVSVLILMAGSRKKGGNKAKVKNLSLGDLVLAKVKGFPAWPAKVSSSSSFSSLLFSFYYYYYYYYYYYPKFWNFYILMVIFLISYMLVGTYEI